MKARTLSTPDYLRKVKRLIQKGWTKHAYARDKHGHSCSIASSKVAKVCLTGAIHRTALITEGLNQPYREAYKAISKLKRFPLQFNDAPTTKKADVLALLDRAIKNETRKLK